MADIKRRLGSLLGPEGRVPQLVEGTTTQLAPSEPASLTLTKIGDAEYRVDAQVPRGLDGDPTAVANFSAALAAEVNTKSSAGRSALDSNFARKVSLDVKDFGAAGDGVTDDYQAIKNAYQALSEAGTGSLLFPPGEYYIGRYIVRDGPDKNDVTDLIIEGCSGVTIHGHGAKIVCKGDFHRSADYSASGFSYSFRRAVSPLLFADCSDVSIYGLEFDGGVRDTTRDSNVVEGASHLIRFDDCKNVLMSEVETHHSMCDGIYIGWVNMCEDFTFINVRSHSNARQGMSISHLKNATFIRSQFSLSGMNNGSYGGHSPQSGIDIEPEWSVDEWTENIHFIDCRIENNRGLQFTATAQSTTRNLYITGGRIAASPESSGLIFSIFAITKGTFRDVEFDTKHQHIQLGYQTDENSNLLFENCSIRSTGAGILASGRGQNVVFDKCQIVGEHTTDSTDQFPHFSSARTIVVRDSHIFFPSALMNASRLVANARYMLMQVGKSENNIYTTDFTPSQSALPDAFFAISHLADTQVVGERYPEAERPIRPSTNTTGALDTPFYKGVFDTGGTQILGGRRKSQGDNPPATGSWVRGDVIYNNAPTPGGFSGWICTTAGSPGTWKGFGAIEA